MRSNVSMGRSVRTSSARSYEDMREELPLMCAGPDKTVEWYSDNLTYELDISGNELQTRAPEALSEIPAEDPANPGKPLFLSADNPWFVAMQKVRPQLLNSSSSVPLAIVQCSLLLFTYRSVLFSALLSSWLRHLEFWQHRTHILNAVAPCTMSAHEERS
jgi:hypothetical protein